MLLRWLPKPRSRRHAVCLATLALGEFVSGPSQPIFAQSPYPQQSIIQQSVIQTQPEQPSYQPIAAPSAEPLHTRSPVIVGLPTAYSTSFDRVVVQPQVQVGVPSATASQELNMRGLQMQRPSAELISAEGMFPVQEPLPAPALPGMEQSNYVFPSEPVEAVPLFEDLVRTAPLESIPLQRKRSSWWNHCPGEGLGQERLPFSLFDIDPAQPFNNFRVRTVLARRMHLPDRAEYFWQRTVDRRGPPSGESVLDYQEALLRMELGSKKISTAFQLPLRATNPELNKNHAGLGDMQLIVKTVLIDGKKWMLTQYFGTYFPTGSPSMGLGTGHVALEPGLLFRNRWNDRTWLHGEAKFWFPLGADPQHGGQVIKVASGLNRVLWESDTAALVPSLEFSTYSVLNGLARSSTSLRSVDGDTMFYITPGMHYAVDRRGDFGLFEIGSGLSLATTRQRFSDSTFTFDLRWSW